MWVGFILEKLSSWNCGCAVCRVCACACVKACLFLWIHVLICACIWKSEVLIADYSKVLFHMQLIYQCNHSVFLSFVICFICRRKKKKINANRPECIPFCVLSTNVKLRVGKNIMNFILVGNEPLSVLTEALVYMEKQFVRLTHNPFKIITLNHIYFRGLNNYICIWKSPGLWLLCHRFILKHFHLMCKVRSTL